MKYFIVLISFLVLSCEPKCPNVQPPLFHKGEKVNMAASSLKKQSLLIHVSMKKLANTNILSHILHCGKHVE